MTIDLAGLEDQELASALRAELDAGTTIEIHLNQGTVITLPPDRCSPSGKVLVLEVESSPAGDDFRVTGSGEKRLPEADMKAIERARLKRERKAQRRLKE